MHCGETTKKAGLPATSSNIARAEHYTNLIIFPTSSARHRLHAPISDFFVYAPGNRIERSVTMETARASFRRAGWPQRTVPMAERVNCPECQAHLFLPSLLAEQTVQCSRCQHVFAPTALRAEPKRVAAPEEDESEYSEPERLVPPGPLTGQWKAAFACVMLGLCVLTDAIQAWVQVEQTEIIDLERKLDVRHPKLLNLVNARIARRNPRLDDLESERSGIER
jgi:hypothetical protein